MFLIYLLYEFINYHKFQKNFYFICLNDKNLVAICLNLVHMLLTINFPTSIDRRVQKEVHQLTYALCSVVLYYGKYCTLVN